MKYRWGFTLVVFFVLVKDVFPSGHFYLHLNQNNFTDSLEDFILPNSGHDYWYNPDLNWSFIHVVAIENGVQKGFVGLEQGRALQVGRLQPEHDIEINDELISNDTSIRLMDDSRIDLPGSIFYGETYSREEANTTLFIESVFNSIAFDFVETNYVPREICIIAEGSFFTVDCISITYIGTNHGPVKLLYNTTENIPQFVEGSPYPVKILNGDLTVQHDDHPSFLLQSIEVSLMHVERDYEELGLSGDTNNYDMVEGRLTLNVEGTVEDYEQFLKSVTYNNLNPEPVTRNRTIMFSVSDGFTKAATLTVNLSVINTNDQTVINFSDGSLVNYTEGSGPRIVDSGLNITDEDTDSKITSVTIELIEEDFNSEYLFINSTYDGFQINKADQATTIYISGNGSLSQYATMLQSLSYLHNDSNPGDPTSGTRSIIFTFVDDMGYESENTLNFTVVPVNDAPILKIVENLVSSEKKHVIYREDAPELYFASNISLRDVDSTLASVTIKLSGALDAVNDVFLLNGTRLTADKTLTLSEDTSAAAYEEILQSFSYINNIKDSTIKTGNRTVSITATDEFGAVSESIYFYIDVQSRNDGPIITINEVLQFIEGSPSVAIATPHVLALMDEENNGISQLRVELVSDNGELDEEDSLLLRTIETDLLDTVEVSKKFIATNDSGTVQQYEDFLRSIRYINQEVEPTYYANETTEELLNREIVIQITDNGSSPTTTVYRILINVTLVNDEKPVISISLVDNSCNASHPVGQAFKYAKRDVHSFNRLHKRLHNKRRSNIPGLAPTAVTTYAQYSSAPEGSSCISNVTIEFSTDTNVPPVEVKRDLVEVISLFPTALNSHLSHGEWLNRKTLLIHLTDCYTDYDLSGLKVVFESQRAEQDCNGTSKCTEGICFRNSTGCPAIGYSSISTNFTPAHSPFIPIQSPTPDDSSSFPSASLVPYIGIVLAAIVIITAFMCGSKMALKDNKGKSATGSKNASLYEIKYSIGGSEVQTLLPQHDESSLSQPVEDQRDDTAIDDPLDVVTCKEGKESINLLLPAAEEETCSRLLIEDLEKHGSNLPLVVIANGTNKPEPSKRVQDRRHSIEQVRTLAHLDSQDR